MYLNLKAEFARRNMTIGTVATLMDMSVSTLSRKVRGIIPFTVNEAKKLKVVLNTDLPLDVLFEECG